MRKSTTPKFTAAQVITALEMSAGILLPAAKILGCDRKTLAEFVAAHPEVEEARAQIQEQLLDYCEASMIQMANDERHPEVRRKASEFLLRTKGKRRGFTTGAEIAGKGGGAVQTETKIVYDISKLTMDELVQLEQAAKAALRLH